MNRSIRIRWGSLKVGLFLISAAAVLMWASLSGTGTSIFDSKDLFVCYFHNVSGLLPGSPVWMSGVEVGNVKSIEFANLDSLRQVKVVCRTKTSVWAHLNKDARIQLGTIGFLGDKYVEIIPGLNGAPPIKSGGELLTIEVGGMAEMFEEGGNALSEASVTMSNLSDFLKRINQGEGTIGKMINDDELYLQMTDLLTNLTALTADLKKNQERIISSIETTAKSLSSLSEKVDKSEGTLGKIISDPQLYDNLSATTARLDTIMNKINSAEGSMGLLVNDTALYVEIVNLLTRVSNMVSDMEKNPGKYFKFSVF
ncbi:MAG: MCE family protein [candidate division Zixibacteria bacterium]|nr:MCE family protein [candidate division Zixibacteria bacterium]